MSGKKVSEEDDFPCLTLESSSDDGQNRDAIRDAIIPAIPDEQDGDEHDGDDEGNSSQEEEESQEAVEVEAASLDRELEVADSRLSPADLKVISNFYDWLQTIDGGLK